MAGAAASNDFLKPAILLQQLAMTGQGVLVKHKLGAGVRDDIRKDVTVNTLDSMERFQAGGYYANLKSLLEGSRNINWYSEEEKAAHTILELWTTWMRGNKTLAVETKARELLQLSKAKGWKKTSSKAAKLLGSINEFTRV